MRGYAALLSTLVICSLLTAGAFQASRSIYAARMHVADQEYKHESRTRAYSCLQAGLYQLARDISYRPSRSGDEIQIDSSTSCVLESIEDSDEYLLMRVRASVERFPTTLEVRLMPRASSTGAPFVLHSFREI